MAIRYHGAVRHLVPHARAFEMLSHIFTRATQQSLREAPCKTCNFGNIAFSFGMK